MAPKTVGIVDPSKIKQWEIQRVDPEIIEGFNALGDLAGIVARALDQFCNRASQT